MLGPNLFNINSSDLRPIDSCNFYFKYADDAYLLVPSSNAQSIPAELSHHAVWAGECNLKLNPNKTSEIIFSSSRSCPAPPLITGVQRVTSLKILGVLVDSKFSFLEHTNTTILACNRSLFALRTLKMHGLQDVYLKQVFKSIILQKLLYASPAWCGYLNQSNLDRYEGFLRRAIKFGYYDSCQPNFVALLLKADTNLFQNILSNDSHALHSLLPERKITKYNLRKNSGYGRILPHKDDRNFISRMLFRDM